MELPSDLFGERGKGGRFNPGAVPVGTVRIEDGDGLRRGELMGEVVSESGAPGRGRCGSSGAGEKDDLLIVAG